MAFSELKKSLLLSVNEYKKIMNIPEQFKDSTFQNYEITDDNRIAFEGTKSYAEKYNIKTNNNGRGIYLYGPTGVGKTHLVSAIIDWFIEKFIQKDVAAWEAQYLEKIEQLKIRFESEEEADRIIKEKIMNAHFLDIHRDCSIFAQSEDHRSESRNDEKKVRIYFTSPVQLLENQKTLFGTKEKQHKILNEIISTDLLVLDDIGSEQIKHSDWELSVLFKIISERYNRRKPIMFTCNYDLGILGKQFGRQSSKTEIERLLSRIVEMNDGFEVQGEDYRLLSKKRKDQKEN